MSGRKLYILTARDISRLVTMRDAIRTCERAFLAYAQGRARMPAKVYLDLPEYTGDFRAMPAFIASPPSAGMKWVSVHPGNVTRGLPTVMGMVLLNDPKTGVPVALLEGTTITDLRTGAAGGVAAKYLARRHSPVVSLVGCGQQAVTQMDALCVTHRIREVYVWGPTMVLARAFIRRHRRPGIRYIPAETVKACVREADIVVTTTPSTKPLVQVAWLKSGVHINAIGADAPGKQELALNVLAGARVYVDEWIQAAHGGEINRAVKRGRLTERMTASIGQVIAGQAKGRLTPTDRTVFDSTGLAIQDIALADWIYRAAKKRRIGHRLALT